MHNIALGITAWCLLSVPTGLALGRILRRHGRRSSPAANRSAPAYASARSSSTSQRYFDDGCDRHQPYDRPGCRHAGQDARPRRAPRRRRRAGSRSPTHRRSRGTRGTGRARAHPRPAPHRSPSVPGAPRAGSSARITAIATTSPAVHVMRGASSRGASARASRGTITHALCASIPATRAAWAVDSFCTPNTVMR